MRKGGMREHLGGERAQAAASAVTRDGVPDLAGGRQSITGMGGRFVGRADLQDEIGRNPPFAAGSNGKKFTAFA